MLGAALLLAAATAAPTAGRVAFLVEASDPAAELTAAIDSPDPLVRAAAARVATVRNVSALLPKVLDALDRESDVNAAREEVRAAVILGSADDVGRVATPARAASAGMLDVIARAAARRADAYEIYVTKLKPLGFAVDAAFFEQALWQRGNLPVAVGSRILGAHDTAAWRALLRALRASEVGMDPNVLGAALNASSEDLRTESVWYLVHAFAFDPAKIAEHVRATLGAPSEEPSLREAYGRELVRRMLGGERKENSRWEEWLQTEEADALIGSEVALFEYFTDRELAARKNHCDIAKNDCRVPAVRPRHGVEIPSADVAQPSFMLPDVLPPGLADAIVREGGCKGAEWLGLARAGVDEAGRVRRLRVNPLTMSSECERVVSALIQLSLASTDSIAAPRETDGLLLVHVAGEPICLDEGAPSAAPAVALRAGNGIHAPTVKRKVQPQFPESARVQMGHGHYVRVIVEATISKQGCVRNLRLLRQSPYPDLNTAALVALAQWRFAPAWVAGEPVDVRFNLTVNFQIP